MNFENIIRKLDEEKIEFFITGSFAVYLYTKERAYNDIDIAVKEEAMDKLKHIFQVEKDFRLSPFNKVYASIQVGEVEFGTFNIETDSKTYIFGLDDKYYQYNCIEFEGTKFKIIDPEELIVLKLFHNRNDEGKRDFEDAKLLVKKVNIDIMKLIILSYKYKVLRELINLLMDEEVKRLPIKPNWKIS